MEGIEEKGQARASDSVVVEEEGGESVVRMKRVGERVGSHVADFVVGE